METVAKHLADQAHQYTQYSGVRPFGVALIVAGIDKKGTRIFVTDPSGTYVSYSAVAIGGTSDDVTNFLEKNYRKDMSIDDAISLAISAINLKNDKSSTEDIKMSKIMLSTQIIEKIPSDVLKKYVQGKNDPPAK